MYRKSMRKALQEARAYRDPLQEDKGFSSKQIKQAYGVLNDPRYKQGNYDGAYRAIQKIAYGLADHPDVKKAMKRANEETITEFKKMIVTIKDPVKRNQAMQDIMKFGKDSASNYVMGLTGPLGNKRPFRIDKMSDGKSFKIDGKGADLNKFAADLKNFYGAEIKAESVEEAKTVGGALAQGHLETMTDQRFKEFYGMTKDEYIKKHGDPRKEELDEALEVKWDSNKQGWFDKQGKRRYLGKMATSNLMKKAIDKAKASGDWVKSFDLKHGQKPEETQLKEGYENNMVTHLGELGIDVSFRLGKMIVYKRDLQKVKDALRDGIADRNSAIYTHRMPDIKTFGEELEEARYRVDGQLSYKGIGSYDGFEVVVNANSEKDAEDKAYDALVKARDKRKIGPGGGRGLDDVEFEGIERTNDPLEAPSTHRVI